MAISALGSEAALEAFKRLIDELRDVKASEEGPYTFKHQYDDFHAVLGTPAGARVYSQIDALLTPPPVPHHQLHDTARLVANNELALVRARLLLILSGAFLSSTGPALNNDDYDPRDNL